MHRAARNGATDPTEYNRPFRQGQCALAGRLPGRRGDFYTVRDAPEVGPMPRSRKIAHFLLVAAAALGRPSAGPAAAQDVTAATDAAPRIYACLLYTSRCV